MASRWFVFWIAMFIISAINDTGWWWLWLLLAFFTGDPADYILAKIKETKEEKNNP